MRILLTGASSFTGFHFARALAAAGHQVTAPLRGGLAGEGDAPRDRRLRALAPHVRLIPERPFGGPEFLDLAAEGWDALCWHGAEVANRHSPDFDVAAALAANLRGLRAALEALGPDAAAIGTGTVFEQGEGVGPPPLEAPSGYGLSKGLSWAVLRHECRRVGCAYGKFVIPNPFGPYEDARFCAYLLRCWRAGEVAEVRTPDYVRDNIHVDLLALVYAGFVEAVAEGRLRDARRAPSGYVESQGAFARRFAREMRARSDLACGLRLLRQTAFDEPMLRVNAEPLRPPAWSERRAWDAIAAYYGIAGAPV